MPQLIPHVRISIYFYSAIDDRHDAIEMRLQKLMWYLESEHLRSRSSAYKDAERFVARNDTSCKKSAFSIATIIVRPIDCDQRNIKCSLAIYCERSRTTVCSRNVKYYRRIN
ncbi:hypothetical protein PUN28_007907 [Cardiocondyla obscurior]|uniref:Uncharacterized protein n=1 Tax=Cardiocondyla obscurior TaxID=286306 RepID=A0AAW2FUW7_9HYME